eukprot:CAMPEP_0198730648 /NCGR_PEP_ID=MMETSP1475-20131203/25469_1 /TAXON_ID= ORGANISM="Unidentified sp., Strain CCMP1999" /NCGR_SAMPLE_ID=MMETSP1475 /ASSEMBLY_ACC=CAM_ASM_001111 /LENGTH=360 /DNA_ID=CAMNT_0044493481 /DNA_START=16 /DNA_END=1094 /DNA_ORIENTATION=+
MKLTAPVAVVALLAWIAAVDAQFINALHGFPGHINVNGPYVARVEYEAPQAGQLRCRIVGNGISAANVVSVPASSVRRHETVQVALPQRLREGLDYTVHLELLQNGRVVRSRSSVSRAAIEQMRFANTAATVPVGEDPFGLDLVYTATERRYLVIAVKDMADEVYLGSLRQYLPAGRDVRVRVRVNVRRPFNAGERCIVRADIRPVDETEGNRLDRCERDSIATVGGVAPATPSPTPSARPTPTPTATPPAAPVGTGGPTEYRLSFHPEAPRSFRYPSGTRCTWALRVPVRYVAPNGQRVRLILQLRRPDGSIAITRVLPYQQSGWHLVNFWLPVPRDLVVADGHYLTLQMRHEAVPRNA